MKLWKPVRESDSHLADFSNIDLGGKDPWIVYKRKNTLIILKLCIVYHQIYYQQKHGKNFDCEKIRIKKLAFWMGDQKITQIRHILTVTCLCEDVNNECKTNL